MVAADEQFNISFILEGEESPSDFQWDPGDSFQLVWGPQKGSSTSITIVNGKRTKSSQFTHIHLYDSVNNEYKDIMDEELVELIEFKIKNKRYRGFKVDGIDLQVICHPTAKKNVVK